jgi:hypothetical protein
VKEALGRITNLQWVLLYLASTVWFLAYVASQQRNYQDSWMLEGVAFPYILIVIAFIILGLRQADNRVVALLTAWTSVVIVLVPPLKYAQPYSTTIDATDHFLMVQGIMETGRVVSSHTYATIPAFHSWLASFGLLSNLSAEQVIRFALPLTAAIMPLVIYFICRRAAMPLPVTKYTILASVLSLYAYYQPNGTGFTLIPLMMLLALIAVQAYERTHPIRRRFYVVVAVIGVIMKTFWHSTTPLILPGVLLVASLTPVVLYLLDRRKGSLMPSASILGFALLSGVLFAAYHFLEQGFLGEQILSNLIRLVSPNETGGTSIPQRLFEVTLSDSLLMALVIHGRDLVVLALIPVGLGVIWTRRKEWSDFLHFYVYFGLVLAFFSALVAVSVLGGIPYSRFLLLVNTISPFFVGVGLWWISHKISKLVSPQRDLRIPAALSVGVLIFGLWMVDFYSYQPMVPRAKALAPGAQDEYLVWRHSVNTAYQERMMAFAEENSDPRARFAVDIAGHRQFRRYFGIEGGLRRGLYAPLFRREEVDPHRVDLFLLHWPGPAGALSEPVEYRSVAKLQKLRDRPGWGLVYDNGESFILLVRDAPSQVAGP